MRRNQNNPLKFTDFILVIGVFISGASLYVNAKNGVALSGIKDELKEINDDGSLRTIAQIGKNNIINNEKES